MFCPRCGTANDDGQKACINCGMSLDFDSAPGQGGAPDQGTAQGYGSPQAPGGQQGYAPPPSYGPGSVYGGPPQQGYGPQPSYTGYGQPYAGFWKRFVAVIIDGIIINIATTILGFILGIGYYVSGLGSAGSGRSAALYLVSLVIWWLYYALMESSSQQATLGKMALGIVVTDLDGRRISFGKASIRHWSKILSYLILLIGYIMAGFTARKQALHDLIAGTLVINKR
jgi:uncharacterized RDD family membrane protein YckC